MRGKVTFEQAEEMRARYARGAMTLAQIGRSYGICESAVSRIVNRQRITQPERTPRREMARQAAAANRERWQALRAEARRLYAAGLFQPAIAVRLGVCQSTVSNWTRDLVAQQQEARSERLREFLNERRARGRLGRWKWRRPPVVTPYNHDAPGGQTFESWLVQGDLPASRQADLRAYRGFGGRCDQARQCHIDADGWLLPDGLTLADLPAPYPSVAARRALDEAA